MRMRLPASIRVGLLTVWVSSVACTGSATPDDAGTTGNQDSGTVTTMDAGHTPDAALPDAALPAQDAAVPTDAAAPDAAPHPDASLPMDGGGAPDAAPPPDAAVNTEDGGTAVMDAGAAPDAAVDPPDAGSCHDHARDIASVARTDQGNMTILDNFPATALNNTRRVTVYVPPGAGPFPVLYAHDGQNLFDPSRNPFGQEWQLDETAAELWALGIKFIVVGIDHGGNDRINELTPVVDNGYSGSGQGELYLDFVAHDLKPYVDFHFNTLCEPENTGMMGSSLGGLITFHAYRAHSDVFGRFAAMSSSFWWANRWTVTQFNADTARHPGRLWIDDGTDEEDSGIPADTSGWNDMVADSRDVAERALALGHTFGQDLGYREAERMAHNEYAWAQRLRSVLMFMWGGPLPSTAQAGYVFALRNPIPTNSRTNAVLNVSYADGRRFTVLPSLAPLQSSNAAFSVTSPGWVNATTAGSTTLTGSYGGVTGAGVLVAEDSSAQREVIFEVDVPVATPAGSVINIPGSSAPLGSWNAAGTGPPLQFLHGQRWRTSLLLPQGHHEYKYTRGSWALVEVYGNGADVPNRGMDVGTTGFIMMDNVERWKDQ